MIDIPRHIESPASHSSPHVHPRALIIPEIGSSGAGSPSLIPGKQLQGPDIVTSSPTHVSVGFYPAAASLEATNPAELPGSRGGTDGRVITTPPHSTSSHHGHAPSPSSSSSPRGLAGDAVPGSRPRAESIEDADRRLENYAPTTSVRKALEFSDTQDEAPPNAFCLDFSSLIGSSSNDEPPQLSHQIRILGSKGDYLGSAKRPSLTPSDISTISVSWKNMCAE